MQRIVEFAAAAVNAALNCMLRESDDMLATESRFEA